MKLYDIAAWIGVALVLLAYALISLEALTASDALYNVLNLVGAGGIMWSSYVKKDYQPVALNFIWGAIALIALVRVFI